jgi:eukaryotic-like serine/threonine-protein kinase
VSDPRDQLQADLADRYVLERELGRGGMATVYLAHDLRHERKVAIKVLRPELSAVIGAERFVREIRTIAALQHPHILGLIDSGEVQGTAYYVMPFVEGESLRDRLTREKQLPIPEAVRIASEVASALDYAHRHGVVHRDIKPENILLHDGTALVADFGIALAVTAAGGTRMTETGMSLGTPHYMSPEQAMGEREITARSDVYALACVTYEMLTGEPPFTGPTAQAIVAKVMTERPRSLVSQRETTPPEVEGAVLTALQKLPADRFASAREFAEALHGDRSHTTQVVRATPGALPRTRVHAAVLTLVGVMALAIGVLAWMLLHRPSTAPQATRFVVTGPGMPQAVSTLTWPAVVSPDGHLIVYAGKAAVGGWQYYVRPVDQFAAIPLPGTVHALQPVFSPDSKWLVFVADGKLKKAQIAGGTAVPLTNAGGGNGAAWLNNGMIVLGAEGPFRGLSAVSETGGALTALTLADSATNETHIWPVSLADGRTILFAIWGGVAKQQSRLAMTTTDGNGKVYPLDVLGMRPLGVVANQLVYLQADGVIMAIPFDQANRRVTGTAVPLLDSIPLCGTCNGDSPVFLSAGGALTYTRGAAGTRVVWVDRTGSAKDSLPGIANYEHARLSPDGRRVAVAIGEKGQLDIWIYQIAGQTLSRLTSQGDNRSPEWMSDGRRIVFVSDRSGKQAVWVQAADRSAEAVMVGAPDGGVWGAVPSPDDRTLVCTTGLVAALVQLRTLPIAGGEMRAYTTGEYNAVSPRFSPDGRWVAYASDQSGRFEVYARPFPGPGTQVQISAAGGNQPVWSPDGHSILYVTDRGMEETIVNATQGLEIISRRLVFSGSFDTSDFFASFDVSRDGTRFLVLQGDDRIDLVAALNWSDEVRARTARR